MFAETLLAANVEKRRYVPCMNSTSALLEQAHQLDRVGRHGEALALLRRAAEAGDATAMTRLGSRLVTGRGAPYRPEQGAEWLIKAGVSGGPAAKRVASALIATGVCAAPDITAAIDGLLAAAVGGDIPARRQLGVLTNDPAIGEKLVSAQPVSDATLRKARRAIDEETWSSPAPAETIFVAPRVQVVRSFIAPAVCDWIRHSAQDRLVGVTVNGADGAGDRALPMRTATGAGYGLLDTDVVMALVRSRIAATSGTPLACFEPANVLHYDVGQEYRPHYDFFNVEVPQFAHVVATQGQRVRTVLVYLNDDYEGGETAFPRLDYAFKARIGDALIFHSVDDAGLQDPRTLHAGLPPTRGRKWLLSQWIRDRPQPIV